MSQPNKHRKADHNVSEEPVFDFHKEKRACHILGAFISNQL